MSVIFGIVNLNDRPVKKEDMETMKSAMDFWGPDGQAIWIDSNVGLGNLLLYNTPEAVFEKLPLTDESGNLVLTATARIDNRNELNRIFGISPQDAMHLPDSYYIMQAYMRWGEDCPDHLLGDWAFAIWNKSEKKLFIARDHHGVTALYYYHGKDFFIFSSSLKGILCFNEIEKKINDYKIAQILIGWNEGGPETCYQDILRLPPAHQLTFKNNELKTRRYWFLEITPELKLKEEQQYIDLFLDIYSEAVKCRLRSYGPVGATLSGGLDSGSVCALASRELKKHGKRLPAFTAVPLYDTTGLVPPNRIGDEGPLAQAVADHCGNIDITFCKAENIGPVEGVERYFDSFPEPIYGAYNAYWIIDILNTASKRNIGTILNGKMGNGTISWPSNDYINRISLISKNRNAIKKIKIIVSRVLPKNAVKFYYNIRYRSNYWISRACLDENFVEKSNIKYEIRKKRWNPIRSFSQTNKRLNQLEYINPKSSKPGELLFNSGSFFKIEMRDPTADKCVLEYSLAIPQEIAYSKFDNMKLIQKSFINIMPNIVLNNKSKGYQAADLCQRLKAFNFNSLKFDFLYLKDSILNNPQFYLRQYSCIQINKSK